MKTDLQHKFKVPEGYFDRMEQEILAKTTETTAKAKIIPLYKQKVFQVAASVAALLVMFFAGWQLMTENISPEDEYAAKEIIYDVYFEEDENDQFAFDEDEVLLAEFVTE